MTFQEVPRVKTISKEAFIKNYVTTQKPVVIEHLTENWPAFKKWSLDYIDKIAGEKIVPLYDDRPVTHNEGFNEPHEKMKMHDYIELLKTRPTNYRIFSYNVLRKVPLLQKDFKWPNLGLRLIKKLPMLFFGGENSKVFMHFDIDNSNILHFHFHGKKRCVLFPPNQTKYLYKVPYALISREDINYDMPDYEKWPALKHAEGYVANLSHGEMLYLPEGYWHYMKYLTPGFSLSLRALPKHPIRFLNACYNVFIMRHFDNIMRRWKGKAWIEMKNKRAIEKTHKKIGIILK